MTDPKYDHVDARYDYARMLYIMYADDKKQKILESKKNKHENFKQEQIAKLMCFLANEEEEYVEIDVFFDESTGFGNIRDVRSLCKALVEKGYAVKINIPSLSPMIGTLHVWVPNHYILSPGFLVVDTSAKKDLDLKTMFDGMPPSYLIHNQVDDTKKL